MCSSKIEQPLSQGHCSSQIGLIRKNEQLLSPLSSPVGKGSSRGHVCWKLGAPNFIYKWGEDRATAAGVLWSSVHLWFRDRLAAKSSPGICCRVTPIWYAKLELTHVYRSTNHSLKNTICYLCCLCLAIILNLCWFLLSPFLFFFSAMFTVSI